MVAKRARSANGLSWQEEKNKSGRSKLYQSVQQNEFQYGHRTVLVSAQTPPLSLSPLFLCVCLHPVRELHFSFDSSPLDQPFSFSISLMAFYPLLMWWALGAKLSALWVFLNRERERERERERASLGLVGLKTNREYSSGPNFGVHFDGTHSSGT